MREEFCALFEVNPDIVGWILVEDTNIDYPVTQRPSEKDYYLKRDFYGKHSSRGCIYAREECDIFSPTGVVTLYGHMMKDGTMFGYLHNFDSQSYYENHPVFYLLTPGRNYRMDIICTAVVPNDSWIYAMQMEEAQLQSWLNKVEDASLIDPISPVNRDAGQYLTLSTCSYEYEDARFVVIGSLKKIY